LCAYRHEEKGNLFKGAEDMKNAELKSAVQKTGLAPILEAAAYISVSRGKMYAMINAGECPSKRFGKSVRVPWAWLHAQAAVASDEGEVAR
jgi:excisionase family DNA binding protein